MKFARLCLVVWQVAGACSIFSAVPKMATPVSAIVTSKDFKIELARSAAEGEGSWIAMCKDAKGRLIISPQDANQPLLRMSLTPEGTIGKIEKIDLEVSGAMGLLYAFDSLYVSGAGPQGLALYRLTDTNKDDQFDKVELLKRFSGAGGEHGSHALALGPDQRIYYMHGNFVKVPADLSPESPHKNYADDVLLPRGEDGRGFGRGNKPPGGMLLRSDKEGKNWEMVAAGMRNTYDFAFNADGEMFAFDSDMEWDWSMPWYRPTRIYHLVSGGDYGFREGTAKWPAYYPDALPPTLDMGIGSPTGVAFGYGAKFPAKYQNALYAMDWSYGRIFAVHLTPKGTTYSAERETFVKGKPLNVTDMVIGDDGAMYFITGGRNTQSGLYRVTYTGPESVATAERSTSGAEARDVRKKLEAFHGKKDPSAINTAWPNLNSPDRWIRYAARIAVESQDASLWSQRALEEQSVDGGLTALLALARNGKSDQLPDLFNALNRVRKNKLDDEQSLAAVRVLQVAMTRMGRPDEALAADIVRTVNPMFPTGKPMLDRELAQVLIYLQAPGIVERCLAQAKASPIFEDQMYYMFQLRTLKTGWARPQRAEYFAWLKDKHANSQHPAELVNFFTEAGREYSDGASFADFINNARNDAAELLSEDERAEFGVSLANAAPGLVPVKAAPTAKDWKTADFAPLLDDLTKTPRNFQSGKAAYAKAQCLACHRMRDEGGSVGPDLTAISQRFTRRDVLESITEPSKVISEQYAGSDFVLKDGAEYNGRILEETDQKIVVLINPLADGRVEFKKSDVKERRVSRISPMPEGLINGLTKDEVLDLIAYMEAAGREK